MKKGLFLFIVLSLSSFLYAQETNIVINELPKDLPASIKESDDYKLAEKYREIAIEAHEAGDYNQSVEYSQKSKEYSDKIIARYGIYQYVLESQRDADRKLGLFKGLGGDTNEITANLYTLSTEDINSANTMLSTATNSTDYTNTMLEYKKSADKSELGYNILFIDLRREYLIHETVLTNGDSNDVQIVSLRDESKNLLSNGDYSNSLTTSRNAMNILDSLEAPLAYKKAQDAMANAKKSGYDISKTDMYNEASKSLSSAGESLVSQNYSDSLMHSKNVISLANLMASTEGTIYIPDGVVFPKYYQVQSRKSKTDSLWRIASYDFIYGNGNLWKKIYEANKDKIKDPSVIKAGQILTIPSLKGETREGTYNPNAAYPNIKNPLPPKEETITTNESSANDTVKIENSDEASVKENEEELKTDETAENTELNSEITEENSSEEAVTEEAVENNNSENAVNENSEEVTEKETSEEQSIVSEEKVNAAEGDVVVEDKKVLEEEQAKTEDTVVDEQTDNNTSDEKLNN